MRWLASICFFFSVNAFSQKASTVSVNDFEKNLDTANVQLLDVRKPEEFKAGHLKGAFQADWLVSAWRAGSGKLACNCTRSNRVIHCHA